MVYPSNHSFLDKNGCVLMVEKYSPFLQKYTCSDHRFKKWNLSNTIIITLKCLVFLLVILVLTVTTTSLFKYELFRSNYLIIQFVSHISQFSILHTSMFLIFSILILLFRTHEGIIVKYLKIHNVLNTTN